MSSDGGGGHERGSAGEPGGVEGSAGPVDAIVETVRALPWLRAFALGLAAFVVAFAVVGGMAYLETAVFVDGDGDGADSAAPAGDDNRLELVGFIFYDAQYVGSEIGEHRIPMFEQFTADATIPPIVWRLVPVAVLLATSWLLARRHVGGVSERAGVHPVLAGVAIGVTLTAGYLVATVIGTELITIASQEIIQTRAILVMGLAYPIVLGAVGGGVAGYIESRADR